MEIEDIAAVMQKAFDAQNAEMRKVLEQQRSDFNAITSAMKAHIQMLTLRQQALMAATNAVIAAHPDAEALNAALAKAIDVYTKGIQDQPQHLDDFEKAMAEMRQPARP